MPCRSEYLNETALEIESRIVAAHLVYVFTKLKQESHITSEMTRASTAYYGNVKMVDEWTALLCATLTGLSETNIDAIVYNARDACSRSLADWWERHQAWDKKREEDEKEKNSTVTLDELRKLGASAKWLEPFEATFGTSAKLTPENLELARRAGLSLGWFAKLPNLTPELVTLLAGDKDWNVRETIARRPGLTPELVTLLAKDEDWSVRYEVASNPNTPPTALAKLSKDESEWVRRRVVENPTYKGARCERQAATRKRDEEVER